MLLDDGTRKYVWGIGLAFAVDTTGNPIVYHADGLGSIRALTDSSGSVAQTYLYDEYGNVTSSQGSITQPFQYTGEVSDPETGLLSLRARYYDAGTGRFTGRDRYPGAADVPQTLNRFAYVVNNPVLFNDPSGLAVPIPRKAKSGGIKEDANSALDIWEVDDSDFLIVMGISPQGAVIADALVLVKLAQKLVGHHTIPKAVLKALPEDVAKAVRGKIGDRNIWDIPEDLHKEIHRGARGGEYNAEWWTRLREVTGAGGEMTEQVLRDIRTAVVERFGLGGYRP